MFDAVALSGDTTGRVIEFVDHLHEHFVTPVDVHDGAYWPPLAAGAGAEMLASTRKEFTFSPPADAREVIAR
jgi:L-fuconate dehydratase